MNVARTALAAALVASAAVALAEEAASYRDHANHWTMTLPPGWMQRDAREAAEVNAELDEMQPGHAFTYVAKFTQAVRTLEPSSPFLLAQWTPGQLDKVSWRELVREFGGPNVRETVEEVSDA